MDDGRHCSDLSMDVGKCERKVQTSDRCPVSSVKVLTGPGLKIYFYAKTRQPSAFVITHNDNASSQVGQ